MIEAKKILAVIPARGGSKGVPKKNVLHLGGKPLLAHIANAARQCSYIDKLILSTDDPAAIEVARDLDIEVPFFRPEELATDRAPLIAVVMHAYRYFKDHGSTYDAVLSLQPTCPFLSSHTITTMIELWIENGCESVTTVAEIVNGHPYIAKRLLADNSMESFMSLPEGMVVGSRHEREKAYYLTGGVYLRDGRLIERAEPKGHCLGDKARAVVVSQLEAIDINSELDFKFAEFLISSGYVTSYENTTL